MNFAPSGASVRVATHGCEGLASGVGRGWGGGQGRREHAPACPPGLHMKATARSLLPRFCSPAGVALTYFVVGAAWIFGSDHLLNAITRDHDTARALQTYKGWAFVS